MTNENIFKPTSYTLLPEYLKVTVIKQTDDDSLNILKGKYPAVFKNLIQEFGNVENIKYAVREKYCLSLLIVMDIK